MTSVTNVHQDLDALTLIITAHVGAGAERAWQLWSDPRQLERWWGPPTHPATFIEHDLTPGGVARYYMTGPDGERYHGWWRIVAVDPPHRLEVEDGFGEHPDDAAPDLPVTTMRVRLTEQEPGRTEMVIRSTYPDRGSMEQVLAMGVVEGITAALGQVEGILAGSPP